MERRCGRGDGASGLRNQTTTGTASKSIAVLPERDPDGLEDEPSRARLRRAARLPSSSMKLLLRWAASAAALLIVAYLVPGVLVEGVGAAFIAALVVGLVNATIGAVVKLITTPIRWLTLGLFTLAINAFLFWLATQFVDGFEVEGPVAALIGAVAYGLLAGVIGAVIGANKKKD